MERVRHCRAGDAVIPMRTSLPATGYILPPAARMLPRRPHWRQTLALLAVGSLSVSCSLRDASTAAPEAPGPNIVIILADDLGWNDVSFHGGSVATPNIDRIAVEGAELARYYVAPVCSPTRAGLMTGRYPIRFGAMRAVYPPWRTGGMDTSERTLADVLGDAGYEHRGIFGKWHLGHTAKKHHPLRRGFTEFYGHYNGAIDYFTHEREGELDWHEGFEPSFEEGYATDLIAERAAKFIRAHASDDTPFLCYVPFNAPHSPFQAKPEDLPGYADLTPARGRFEPDVDRQITAARNRHDANRRILGAMVDSLDQAVGKILNTIDESGISERTLVLFSSDNGGVSGVGENTPLRGGKATVFEGGIRVAAAVRWPGTIPVGQKIEEPIANIDILPTLMRVAGIREHGGKPLDGLDVLDVWKGNSRTLERELFNYIGQTGPDTEQISYMTNDWKLVVLGPVVTDETADDTLRKRLLFRISEDPFEEHDVIGEHPDIATEMYEKILEFRALQPPDAVVPYQVGREGFKAPKMWEMLSD